MDHRTYKRHTSMQAASELGNLLKLNPTRNLGDNRAKWLLGERKRKRSPYIDKTFDKLMLNYLKAAEKEKRAPDRDKYALAHLYPAFNGQGDKPHYVAGCTTPVYFSTEKPGGRFSTTTRKWD